MRMIGDIRQVVNSLCISLAVVLVGMLGSAAAQGMPWNATFGGTSHNATQIDVNADGVQAGITSAEVQNSVLGNYSCTGITEEIATDPTTECPGGVFVIDAATEMGYGALTCTFPNGDQLYFNILTRTLCADASGGLVGEDTGEITDGTGRFAGTTGNFEQTFTGFFQTFDLVSNQGFASFTGEATGNIILPPGTGDPRDCNNDGVVNALDLAGIGC